MKKLPLSLLAIVVCFVAYAQQTTFRIQYNIGAFDFPSGMTQAPGGGNYVFSSFTPNLGIPLGTQGGLTAVNLNGNHVWSKLYRTSSSPFTTDVDLSDVKNSSAGGFIVTGSSGGQALLMKTDATGNITWSYRYIPQSGASSFGNKVIQTSDGGYLVAGSANTLGAGRDSSKLFAFKTDASGTLSWARVFIVNTGFDDDDYLTDVVETSDGYAFVGYATMVAGDGQSDAVIVKTNTSGAVQWAGRFGNSNSEDIESIISDGGTNVVMSGLDNLGAYILNMSIPNSGPSVTGTNTRYYSTGLPVTAGNLTKTYDNNFAIFASGATFGNFTSILAKVNRNTGAVIFAKSYNSFISLLPTGIMAADSGFLINSISADTTGSGGAYDFGVTKTDINGNQGGSGCAPSNVTILTQNYSPTITIFSPTTITTGTRNSGSVTASNVTPTTVIACRSIACNAPATPTVTSSGNNICSGTQVTINASGGTNVTYRVYTQASGGTSIGTTPLSVSPTTTTTYYVEADDNNNPGCVSARGSVTVTVVQPPANVGAISGPTAPCVGASNYSITAVNGATSYSWAVSGGGNVTSSTTSATVNWTTAGGPYTITVTATNTCGSKTATLAVNVLGSVANVNTSASPNPACAGGTLTLTGTGDNVTTWSWSGPAGFTAATQNASRPNLTVAHSGAYTLTASNSCNSLTSTVNVTVNDIPQTVTASASPNPACVGNAIQLTGSAQNATSWSWSGPNTFTAATQNATVPNAQTNAAGTYTLTATNSCGNNTATVDVVVNDVPQNVTATANGANPNAVCPGATLNLSGSATGASSYSWSGPNNYTSAQLNSTVNNFQQANAGTYTLVATNNCGTAQATVNVTISSGPVNTTATANLTNICSQATLSLTGASTGATSYSWSGPNGFTSTQQNPTIANVTLADSGLYTLVATNVCGTASATVNVDVDTTIQNVTVNAQPNDTICAGGNITLNGSGTQVNTWSWSGPAGYSSTLQNPVINNATVANSGTYTLSAGNACGTVTSTVEVLVNEPIANLSATTVTGAAQCAGSIINFTASGSNVNGWSWSGPDGFTSTQQNPVINPATVASSGTYTLTAFNGCANQTVTLTVQIDTAIENVTTTAAPDDTICAGTAINLTAGGTNVTSWGWTGPNGFTASQQNATVNNTTTASSGDYIVTATNACGSSSDTVTVLVNAVPVAPAAPNGPVNTCGSDTATYIVTTVPGATSYNWSLSGGGTIISGQGTATVDVSWGATAGTYTISVTAANNCGASAPATATITVGAPAPVMNATISGSNSVCPVSETYSISSIPNATTYTWAVDAGGNIASGQGTTSIVVTWNTPGTHQVSVIATNACGTSAPATLSVTVNPEPTVPTVNLTANDTTICEGTSVVLSASGSTGGNVSYNFYDAATGGNMYGSNPLTVSPTATTVYYLEVINQFGCVNNSGRIPVTVNVTGAPTVQSITGDNVAVCYGTAATLTANATPTGTTITWWDAATGGNQVATGSSYTIDPITQTTVVYAQATNSNGCLTLQGRVAATAVVIPHVVIDTLSSDKPNNIIFPNEVINFTAVPDTFSNYEFFWNGTSVQNGPSATWSSSKIQDQDSVWVIATDNGCSSSRSQVLVRVVDFPNAFTPNNDGVNDVFLAGYDLVITNRWGQTMYEGRDGWDGKYKGDKVSPGTYYYIVMLDNITDRKNAIKGTVLLVEE